MKFLRIYTPIKALLLAEKDQYNNHSIMDGAMRKNLQSSYYHAKRVHIHVNQKSRFQTWCLKTMHEALNEQWYWCDGASESITHRLSLKLDALSRAKTKLRPCSRGSRACSCKVRNRPLWRMWIWIPKEQ